MTIRVGIIGAGYMGRTHAPGLEQPIQVLDFSQLPRAEQWGYRAEDAAFISACLGESAPAVDVDEAYKSIELCEACYRSAANGGAEVRLPLGDVRPA